jgi:K+-transporting ATPase c subunit
LYFRAFVVLSGVNLVFTGFVYPILHMKLKSKDFSQAANCTKVLYMTQKTVALRSTNIV